MAQYADILHAMEKGTKNEREEYLLRRYLPDTLILLDWLAVVCDKYGIIVLWYLPGAIDPLIQVSSLYYRRHYSNNFSLT